MQGPSFERRRGLAAWAQMALTIVTGLGGFALGWGLGVHHLGWRLGLLVGWWPALLLGAGAAWVVGIGAPELRTLLSRAAQRPNARGSSR